MFTGIIKNTGTLKKKITSPSGGEILYIGTHKMPRPKIGQSICVNGVCLTATKTGKDFFAAEVIRETLALTTLGKLSIGAQLNLEQSLKMSDFLDGHLVMGHVDSACPVIKKIKTKHGETLSIKVPLHLMPYIATKGSVALNGVSLTVVEKKQSQILVALTQYTEKTTNLGNVKKGDMLNVEVDIIARYLQNVCA